MTTAPLGWAASTFAVSVDCGRREEQRAGYVRGRLAVHRDNEHRRCCGPWNLTHLPTGAHIANFRTRGAAVLAANELLAACSWDFGQFHQSHSTGAIRRSSRWRRAAKAVAELLPQHACDGRKP